MPTLPYRRADTLMLKRGRRYSGRYSDKVTRDSPPNDARDAANELAQLQIEIERLRVEIARLQRQNSDLLKTIIDRDYERPPHYR